MGYVTYTTEAVVCGSRDSNTSDRSYLLFTRQAGMVWATARSVREERSRQRFALQDYAHIRVSLVKGKAGWRIGSVEAIDNAYLRAPQRAGRASVVTLVRFLRRFVQGEEPLVSVFDDVVATLPLLSVLTDMSQGDELLTIFEVRALHQLGYLASSEALQEVLNAPSVTAVSRGVSRATDTYISQQLVSAKAASQL